MAHQDDTLGPDERVTPEKADAFVARDRPDRERLAAAGPSSPSGSDGIRRVRVARFPAEDVV